MPVPEIVTAAVTHGSETWKVNGLRFALPVSMGRGVMASCDSPGGWLLASLQGC